MKQMLKRALLLCLCAALCWSAAAAEEAAGAADLSNTPDDESLLDCCVLPGGQTVFAGYAEKREEQGKTSARLLCLNTDRTVCWEYAEPYGSDAVYGEVVLTEDGTLAVLRNAESGSGIRFFTADGKPAGNELPLPSAGGEMVYELTSFGVIRGTRGAEGEADRAEMTDWDGNVLFEIGEPESMWAGTGPLAEGDGLVLYGQEAGRPSEAAAKIMKIDLRGCTVWETILPFLSDRRESTGLASCIRTGDGGYLAVIWDFTDSSGEGVPEGNRALVKLDAGGRVLWMNRSGSDLWCLAEYNGKYAAYDRAEDLEDGLPVLRYLWLDPDGNELGQTELRIREEDIPRYTDRGQMSVSVEQMIPMKDGLWQHLCFLGPDDPASGEPAWVGKDDVLVRVPEP